ncbi:hypothetical protein M3Y99_00168000 [Aphelenchoides fujianensis]|nr:hypothetical protein M3Y99_00168000 [Aphelenchoides fujianensis]
MVEFLNDRSSAAPVDPIALMNVSPPSELPTSLGFPPTFGALPPATVDVPPTPLALSTGELQPLPPNRPSMSLAQLSCEYAAYVLLNQSGIDHNTIMAASAALPKLPVHGMPPMGSLTSLLPYANILTLLNNNLALLRQLSALQSVHAPPAVDPLSFGAPSSAATCASSIPPSSGSPTALGFESNLVLPPAVDSALTPTSISPINWTIRCKAVS